LLKEEKVQKREQNLKSQEEKIQKKEEELFKWVV
jgi:hypothetical protein